MRTLFKIFAAILTSLAVSVTVLITFPLLLLFVGVKIIGGAASKIN